jgi:hypothetical protein
MQRRPAIGGRNRKGYLPPSAILGDRSAVETKSAGSVQICHKFAGCDDKQSGQRFLNSSAPRLIRQVASCEAAAGGKIPLTAGKEEKLFRGAGQSPAIQSRRAAPVSFSRSAPISPDSPPALDDSQITAVIEFFQILDRWDREAHGN